MTVPVYTTSDLLAPASDDEQRAWTRLRALRIGDQHGWYTYLGGDRVRGRYALRLPDGTVRLLHRDRITNWQAVDIRRNETLPWLHGNACGHDQPDAFDTIEAHPPMLDINAAAAALGISLVALNVRARSGSINPLYLARRLRRFFVAEIDAINHPTDPDAQNAWHDLREQLPSTVRLDQLVDARPAASPDPLPIPADQSEAQRRLLALDIGTRRGWFAYTHGGGDTFTVEVPGGHTVTIPGPHVLPWVWGVADAHGEGDQVAYR